MSDELTADQEARRRYPDGFRTYVGDWEGLRSTFVAGAEFNAEREKARAEAAEARVSELEAMLTALVSKWDEVLPEIRATATIAYVHGHRYTGPAMSGVIREARELLTTPTTEAVTE